jgi:hypothetical protein
MPGLFGAQRMILQAVLAGQGTTNMPVKDTQIVEATDIALNNVREWLLEVARGGRRDVQQVVENASMAFDQALARLKPMCSAIVRQVRDAAEQPEEIAVEFGIKLSAEAGIILTSTSGEANPKMSVKWKRVEPKAETP